MLVFRNLPRWSSGASSQLKYCHNTTYAALRANKSKSKRKESDYFVDAKIVRTIGGKGGDGCVSFLQLWSNERAGPDGGDGGNGGHVIFQAAVNIRNLNHINSLIKAEEGETGSPRECHGKNAKHMILKVPVGTIVRDELGRIVGDLAKPDFMFVAARGGTGGKGNRFFATATENSPKVCEYGPAGEDVRYLVELRSIADIGLIGYPNAGKSTLLNAISRARSKIAPHAFTTLRPHVGVVQYEDHMQLAIADLPGLIDGSHLNRGLGIQFLKHAERCKLLLFIVDASTARPWDQYRQLLHELQQYNAELLERPRIIVANKMDQPEAVENLPRFRDSVDGVRVLPISAKMGLYLAELLHTIREYYEKHKNAMK